MRLSRDRHVVLSTRYGELQFDIAIKDTDACCPLVDSAVRLLCCEISFYEMSQSTLPNRIGAGDASDASAELT